MRTYLISLLFFCFNANAIPIQHRQAFSPIVQTSYGKLRGLRNANKDEVYDEFLGIPSAKPPVGALRWERPLPPESWTGIKNATSYPNGCISIEDGPRSEDCLYLNVFVPHGVDAKGKFPLPVMVWAHGGGFILGETKEFPGHDLAFIADVIVVTFQYRLSALGGLSTSDAIAPGNYHLWDARASLLWVRDNIKVFGGDPTRVTIFGESAGGALTNALVLSPLTDGLFHRVISISGNVASPIGLQYKSRFNAQNLASVEECPNERSSDMIKCLRERDAGELDQAGYLSMVGLSGILPGWLPTVDGSMITDLPKTLWNNGGGKNIDFMVGRAEHECGGMVYLNPRGEPRNVTLNLAADKVILNLAMQFLLQSYAPGEVDVLLNAIRKEYPDYDSDDELKRTKAVAQIATDWIFASPAHFEAQAHVRNAAKTGKNTFFYNFKYRGSFFHYKPWIQGSHSDMVYFAFGEPFRKEYRENTLGEFSEDDQKVKENIMKYFGNFAHTGDSNKGPHKVVLWPKYNPDTNEYVEFSAKVEAKKVDEKVLKKYDFWLNEWPKITNPESPQNTHHDKRVPQRINMVTELVKRFALGLG